MDKTTIKGYSNAILSAASFGLIPLFTIPILNEGMGSSSVLMYRFAFGCLIMLGILMFNKTRMYIGFGDFLRILFLSSLYAVSAIALLEGYKYMPGGIATTLLFSYPVWTALLSIAFLHEHLSRRTTVAIILAVGGVALLSGLGGGGEIKSFLGPVFEMLAGLLYAVYMVTFPVIKVRKMPSLKLTFYIFFFTMILMLFYTSFTTGHIQPISSPQAFFNLVMLGLFPTAISNVTLIIALKQTNSTMVAVLGAFEPMTAMVIGILVFNEHLTVPIVFGFLLIIISVLLLVLRKRVASQTRK